MDEKLLIYFEDINDGTPQGSYLNEFTPKEARNGICLHLVLTWFYNYKLAGGNTAPNIIWQEMKNPTMIKQIANNQMGYKRHNLRVGECIALYKGLQYFGPIQGVLPNEIQELSGLLLAGTGKILYCIDLVKDNELVGRHAIGLIIHNNRVYLFEPNIGVLSCPVANRQELLDKLRYIYEIKGDLQIREYELYIIRN